MRQDKIRVRAMTRWITKIGVIIDVKVLKKNENKNEYMNENKNENEKNNKFNNKNDIVQ